MNKLLLLFSLVFAVILFSCTNDSPDKNSYFIELSDLKINQEALPDGEIVHVIYSPGYITSKEEDFSYYSMVMAVSQKTGDTIKILIFPSFSNATPSNNEREFVAYNTSRYNLFVGVSLHGDPGDLPKPTKVKMNPINGSEQYSDFPVVIGLLAGGEPQ